MNVSVFGHGGEKFKKSSSNASKLQNPNKQVDEHQQRFRLTSTLIATEYKREGLGLITYADLSRADLDDSRWLFDESVDEVSDWLPIISEDQDGGIAQGVEDSDPLRVALHNCWQAANQSQSSTE